MRSKPSSAHFISIRMADRKSTRLNSSHVAISYAVFCLKKKKAEKNRRERTKKEAKAQKYRQLMYDYKQQALSYGAGCHVNTAPSARKEVLKANGEKSKG